MTSWTMFSSNGLFIERETGQFAFAHKTFQEYLAAEHIRANGLVNELARLVNDEWWAETTLLYVAKSDADPIIKACLEANSGLALALALDCTNQDGADVDPDLRERVNDLVRSAAGSQADGGLRRLFAGILLARHMRQRERTSDGVQICVRPIPMDIYRLFVADTQTPYPDAPEAREGVAVGMRGVDAVAFVSWAIAVSGAHQGYRLPREGELAELASQQRIPALLPGNSSYVWAQPDNARSGALPKLWLHHSVGHPYEIKNFALVSAVKDDLARSGIQLGRLLLLLRSRVFVRVLSLALDLALRGDIILDCGQSEDRDTVIARVRDRIGDLDRVLSLDRILDFSGLLDFNRDLFLDLDDVLQFNKILASGVTDGLANSRALVLDRLLVRVLNSVLVRVLDGLLDLGGVLDVTVEIDNSIHQYLLPRNGEDLKPTLEAACRLGLGRAFSQAIEKALLYGKQPEYWLDHFASAFIEAAEIDPAERLATNPADLAVLLNDSTSKLIEALSKAQGESSGERSWSIVTAKRLAQIAEPIFTRVERLTSGRAAYIRMAALCLSAEAESIERKEIAEMFRRVAAGVTFLEQRASGDQQARELIMLAVTPS